jgi:hypothetical protein
MSEPKLTIEIQSDSFGSFAPDVAGYLRQYPAEAEGILHWLAKGRSWETLYILASFCIFDRNDGGKRLFKPG